MTTENREIDLNEAYKMFLRSTSDRMDYYHRVSIYRVGRIIRIDIKLD